MANWKSALSKFGAILAQASTLIPVAGPLIGAFVKTIVPSASSTVDKTVSKAADFSTAASSIVANVEAFGQAMGAKGPDKLKAAVGPMVSALYASEAFYGTKIQNEALFSQGAQKIADGFADCWNAVHPDSVTTIDAAKG